MPTLRASSASPTFTLASRAGSMDISSWTSFKVRHSPNRKSPSGNYYKKDIKAVAAAFQQLTDIKMPAGTAPGPIGGGRIGHDFFVDCLSTLKYTTVEQLEEQINGVCFPLAFSTSH